MGNCQAASAAAVVIQHPGGKVERLYWPATAADVMRSNPGHYVALVVLRVSGGGGGNAKPDPAFAAAGGEGAKITKVKLLKPKDTLLLGQVYRLITSQEVTKALRARKNEKMHRCESIRQQHEQLRRGEPLGDGAEQSACDQDAKREKDRHRSSGAPPAGSGRGRHWRPSLQSISEAAGQSSTISESTAS